MASVSDKFIDSKKKVAYLMFDKIANTYDLINSILSMGIDRYWRNILLNEIPDKKNMIVLDLATGTGEIALKLGASTKIKKIVAVDLSEQMIGIARKKYSTIKNRSDKSGKAMALIDFLVADGVTFQSSEEQFDLATIGFGIRNMYDPAKTLANIYQMLKKDGKILVLELAVPQNSFFKKTFLCYFRYILPKLGGIISRNHDAYNYLNESVEIFPSGNDFANLLKGCGFNEIKTIPLTFGIANLYEGKK